MRIPYSVLQTITDFGDSGVIGTCTLCGSALLAGTGEVRAAARILATTAVAAATIGCAKIYFLGCGNTFTESLHLYSPSGHAALTTAFCAALARYASIGRNVFTRVSIWLFAAAVTGAISISRVLLGYHSKTEILMGFLVGLFAYAVVTVTIRGEDTRSRTASSTRYWLPALLFIALISLHGHRLPAERVVRGIASYVHENVTFCRSPEQSSP